MIHLEIRIEPNVNCALCRDACDTRSSILSLHDALSLVTTANPPPLGTVLDQTPSDPKALFRRCQALEALGRVQEAYRDARHLHNEQPDSKDVQPLLTRLYAAVQKQVMTNCGSGQRDGTEWDCG